MATAAAEKSRVLVVDDEPQITRVLRTVLTSQGYQVRTATEGEAALSNFTEWRPELVITDLYMPHMDGIELCKRIRTMSNVPIIVLSVKGEERSKVEALDCGADDYVTKPFGIDELLARINATLRRSRPAPVTDGAENIVRFGDVVVDMGARSVTKAGAPVRLTPTEFALLRELVINRGALLSHATLLRRVWGPGYATHTEYTRVYIRRLRAKLETPGGPTLITTEPRSGYRLVSD